MTLARYAREATKHLAPVDAVSAISGLLRWFSADTLALADNSPVSTWPDRSGNGGDLTAAGAARPTLVQSRWNGKPAVVFSNSSSGGQILSDTTTDQPTGDITVFCVYANYKYQSTSPRILAWGNGSTFGVDLHGNGVADANNKPPSLLLKRAGGAWMDNWATATVFSARGEPVIATAVASGATTKVRVDKANLVTDSGDTGSIDYGTGTIKLTVGDKYAAGTAALNGEIYEILIFDRALTDTEIATVEDYLDQKWRVTLDHASLVGLFNGESAVGSDYQIGLAWTPDGRSWRRSLANPVFSKNGTGWERDLVKDPQVIWDGTQYVLFYSGWTSVTSKFQIGRATSPDLVTWTRDTHNPVIALGGSGAIDEDGAAFPTVIYDLDEPDPTRRWKCWYTATDASGKATVAYAYSSDGVTWTKYGRVIDVGAAGAWDAIGVSPAVVYRDDDGTYYIFYGGAQNSGSNPRWQTGVATFTNPESTYTKYASNPTVKADYHNTGSSESLTADLAASGRTVTVADTSGFTLHEPIVLDRHTSGFTEANRILTIDSSTQLTLEWPTVNAYPTSDSSVIRSAAYNSIGARAIRKLADGTFELHATAFQPVSDLSHSGSTPLLEMSVRLTLSSLTASATPDYTDGLLLLVGDAGSWDEISAENFSNLLTKVPQRFVVMPFIDGTIVYAPTLVGAATDIAMPFIDETRVYGIFSLFDPNRTFSGPGNGGEAFLLRLAPNGVTETATLAADITAEDTLITLTGDGSLPSTEPFVVTIDSEVIYLVQTAPGSYRVRGRAMSNTTAATHTAGATVAWGDSYEMAIVAALDIAHSFTADIESSGTFTYPGWLVCFDSTQAYLAGSRYPMHVTEVVGVFDAGAGATGTNRVDGTQPNAICTPAATSDDCPAALSNPARISTDITAGDVALVRYTNPEASVLDLGPRSTSLQSWFGLKRVDDTDTDVTFTDPTPPDSGGHGAHVVDTIPGTGPYTGAVNDEWLNPSAIGISPETGDPTPNPAPYTTVTLPGSDRFFTDGIHYSEKGWPFGVLAVRQGNRRVPLWESYDWHNFSYVYTGFGVDDTFAQIVVNRNGVSGAEPEVVLPGSQDISGPDAVWDDGTYYFAASWYVAIFNGPYLVLGPAIGALGPGGGGFPTETVGVPIVTFPGGSPVITPPGPPPVEGGSGGDIAPPALGQLFQAAAV